MQQRTGGGAGQRETTTMKTLRVMMMAVTPLLLAGCLEPPSTGDVRTIPVPDEPEDEPCLDEDCPPALIEPGDCEGELVVECVNEDGMCVWSEECVEPPPPPPAGSGDRILPQ